MEIEVFNKVVERRLEKVRETLIKKAAEYAAGGDRLHNFKKGVLMNGKAITPAQLLKGFKLKHDISVDDMIEGQTEVTPYLIDEKIGDQVCYAILLEAIFWEEVGGLPEDKALETLNHLGHSQKNYHCVEHAKLKGMKMLNK